MTSWDPWTHVRAEHPDVQVVEMELPPGLQGCVDHEKQIIWLAKGLGPVQRTCTLAYEIGQLKLGPLPNDPCLAAAHRRSAEDWAARMLIPADALFAGFACCTYIPDIAEHLGVDVPMLRTRLRGLTDSEQDACMDAIRGMRAVA